MLFTLFDQETGISLPQVLQGYLAPLCLSHAAFSGAALSAQLLASFGGFGDVIREVGGSLRYEPLPNSSLAPTSNLCLEWSKGFRAVFSSNVADTHSFDYFLD